MALVPLLNCGGAAEDGPPAGGEDAAGPSLAERGSTSPEELLRTRPSSADWPAPRGAGHSAELGSADMSAS